jgi:hypothetical protein
VTAALNRYPWTEADEQFLINAKRQRFNCKDIAVVMQRSENAVFAKVRILQLEGVLMRHRKEEMELLDKLYAEARTLERR